MEEYPTKRLMQYAAYKGISISAFEKSIGKAPSYLRNSKDITSAVMDTLKKKYPDLSIDWLITGKGSMINNIVRLNIDKEKVRGMQNVPDYIEIPEQAKDIIERVLQGTSKDSDNPVMVAEPSTKYGENEITTVLDRIRQFIDAKKLSDRAFSASIGVPSMTLSSIFKRHSDPSALLIATIVSVYPDVSPDWLLLGKGEMLKSVTPAPVGKASEEKGIPYYADLPVSAGQLDIFMQDAEPTGWVNLPGVRSKALFPVVGCSMKPEINPGDVVGIVQMESWEMVDPDKTYLIITNEDRMIKHLARDEEDDTILWCISPNYPKFKINKDDIKFLYRISFCGKLM